MNQEEVVIQLESAHEELKRILSQISEEDIQKVLSPTSGWTVKDILSHLTVWNLQFISDIDAIFRGEWIRINVDEFNQKAVDKDREVPYLKVYSEWEKSLEKVIDRVKSLSSQEWNHRCGEDVWKDGSPIDIKSLFDYRYQGEPHEAGHAKEIKAFFKLD